MFLFFDCLTKISQYLVRCQLEVSKEVTAIFRLGSDHSTLKANNPIAFSKLCCRCCHDCTDEKL